MLALDHSGCREEGVRGLCESCQAWEETQKPGGQSTEDQGI